MRVRAMLTAGCTALLLASATAVSADPGASTARAVPDWVEKWKDWRDKNEAPDWQYKGVKVLELDSDIKHYIWELRVGEGPYDKIAVHRYVREPRNDKAIPEHRAPDRRKVLFVINGTWGQEGDEPIEEFDSYYFPKNGYDYWTMDFRTAYIPNMAYDQFEEKGELEGLMSTAEWTYDAFREDIKKAVELAKEVSGARQVFMAGRSRGGSQAFIYAAKYADDLKGLIGLDGGPIYRGAEDPEAQRTEAEYQQAMEAVKQGEFGPLLSEVTGYRNGKLLGALPYVREQVGAPLPDESELPPEQPLPAGYEINDLMDLAAYESYWAWGEGKVTNYYTPYPGGSGETYMDKDALLVGRSNYSRYWPAVQNVEASFLQGYADNPYLDYDDTADVTVPVIHFVGELGCPDGVCTAVERPYSTASEDFSVVYLPGYGHLDVYYGTHSEEDVKQPMLEWMNARL